MARGRAAWHSRAMAAPAPNLSADDPSFSDLLAARPHLSMHAHDGLLMEDVPLSRIAAAEGTPVWVYSAGAMRTRYRRFTAALAEAGLDASVHYAMKANDHLAVASVFAREGAGADVVSEGELLRARAAGIAADRIVFSGVGKSVAALRLALEQDIMQLNVESAEELAMISAIASGMGRVARVALRVNPDVDAGTHAKITTGKADNKFGIPFNDAAGLYAHAATLPGIDPVGIALHIGSQITALAPYRAAYARAAELVHALRARGLEVRRVDGGGGIGIAYRDELPIMPAAFAGAVKATLGTLGVPVMFEPGRSLVASAGVLLSSVVLTKPSGNHRFVILDAAMNDLVRPSMYDAWHGILPLAASAFHAPLSPADVVGPVCETGDTFTRGRALPPLAPGDGIALLDAGAYGAVMSSTYNARPLAAEVMVDGSDYAVIRPRQTLESLWAHERVPGFVTG